MECDHVWKVVDSMANCEVHVDVVCTECRVLGERDTQTGYVTWPVT